MVLAVIVFKFVTKSIINNELYFNLFVEMELLKYIVSSLAGGFIGGLIYVIMTINRDDRQVNEKKYWLWIKENNLPFYITNVFAFSFGGFLYTLVINLFDLSSFDNLISTLFPTESIVDYVGMTLAAAVFSILLSIGIKKRLNLLYSK